MSTYKITFNSHFFLLLSRTLETCERPVVPLVNISVSTCSCLALSMVPAFSLFFHQEMVQVTCLVVGTCSGEVLMEMNR